MSYKNRIFSFSILIILLFIFFLLDIFTGSSNITLRDFILYFIKPDSISDTTFILIKEFRLPRSLIALFAGASLSISGLYMQTIFRNPLADPYILGISNGASLGVAIVILSLSSLFINLSNFTTNYILLFSASLGSAVVLILILLITIRIKDNVSILIIGILISGIVGSVVSILQFFAKATNVKSFIVWTMGNLNSVSYSDITYISIIIIIFTGIAFIFCKKLNIFLLGEHFAKSMGVNIKFLRIFIFIIVSILTGTITAFCGPLGFVGIVVPHVARWIFKTSNHFILFPAVIIIGSCFMLLSDIISHAFTNNVNLPINSVTAIIGLPFIIWLVIKNKRNLI